MLVSFVNSCGSTRCHFHVYLKRNFASAAYTNTGPVKGKTIEHLRDYTTVQPRTSQQLTKNLFFVSQNSTKIKFDAKTLRLNCQLDKPLVLVMGWLMSQPRHLEKVAKLYTEQNYDALLVRINIFQLMFPKVGGQFIAAEVLKFMQNNQNSSPIVIHGFSAGGYVWSEAMLQMEADLAKYQPLLNRIKAQIWDSLADISEMPIGISKTAFSHNRFLEWLTRTALQKYLQFFYNLTTVHFEECKRVYFNNLVRAPALICVSKTDLIGTERLALELKKNWSALNIPVTLKCWDKSPHIRHLAEHREEYIDLVKKHLEPHSLLPSPEKFGSKP